ncbi:MULTISPECIES: hypothetical protein [unclassified Lacrimispora]|uniref:hypothetical protein n=1 Tax=unclassified Lacrimispora TaxID=2719232 RepID=UPI00376F4D30
MYFEFTKKNHYVDDDGKEKDFAKLESQYKKFVKEFHPDNGGNDSDFTLMKNEFEEWKKVIADTIIISKEADEIEKLIKSENHPGYPNYSSSWNNKLWNYYSYLYKFDQNFTKLAEHKEIVDLFNLDIKLTTRVYGSIDSYSILIFFKSDRKHIDNNIESIFGSLRNELKNLYPGFNFSFIVDCSGNPPLQF